MTSLSKEMTDNYDKAAPVAPPERRHISKFDVGFTPQYRPGSGCRLMSAMCPKPDLCSAANSPSFDHFVGAQMCALPRLIRRRQFVSRS
jgi:hypothetical protein